MMKGRKREVANICASIQGSADSFFIGIIEMNIGNNLVRLGD